MKQRSDERKEREKQERIKENEIWDSLESMSDSDQLRFFIKRFGPLSGKSNYSQWKSTQQIAKSTSILSSVSS